MKDSILAVVILLGIFLVNLIIGLALTIGIDWVNYQLHALTGIPFVATSR